MLINIRTSYTSYIISNILINDFLRQPQRHLDLRLVVYHSKLLLLCTWSRSYSDQVWPVENGSDQPTWLHVDGYHSFLQKRWKNSGTCPWYTRNMKRPIRYLLMFTNLMMPNSLYIASQFFLAFICDMIRMALFWWVVSFFFRFV